ncbi:4'-phosphopantetheinyl transferase family protein [Halomonas binhaiensis]|uniref:Enterobactin synthase component D n=1 Tax=Halomonas binhaiensis TaxID=2562282 RepID=A0A5C1NDF3_9GAMM|nr:4'-phosphopantetheinyl transferase superfamily protein [Halomonas binhaiensis]QEM80295.1 4'-phosphopantetheinyl transferase superfamily protein [Halomonas binhaiensis]
MLHTLLPCDVVVVEAEDGMWEGYLHPDEATSIARAFPGRRREFTAGRACARAALARLGVTPRPLLCDADRVPQWPPGTTGSITHCDGYCAAAVAWQAKVRGVGIDAEVLTPLGKEVELICSPAELQGGVQAGLPAAFVANVIFSAKESFYKCYYPLARQFLEFSDVEIIVIDDGCFEARLVNHSLPDMLGFRHCRGRFALHQGHVFAAVVL